MRAEQHVTLVDPVLAYANAMLWHARFTSCMQQVAVQILRFLTPLPGLKAYCSMHNQVLLVSHCFC